MEGLDLDLAILLDSRERGTPRDRTDTALRLALDWTDLANTVAWLSAANQTWARLALERQRGLALCSLFSILQEGTSNLFCQRCHARSDCTEHGGGSLASPCTVVSATVEWRSRTMRRQSVHLAQQPPPLT